MLPEVPYFWAPKGPTVGRAMELIDLTAGCSQAGCAGARTADRCCRTHLPHSKDTDREIGSEL